MSMEEDRLKRLVAGGLDSGGWTDQESAPVTIGDPWSPDPTPASAKPAIGAYTGTPATFTPEQTAALQDRLNRLEAIFKTKVGGGGASASPSGAASALGGLVRRPATANDYLPNILRGLTGRR